MMHREWEPARSLLSGLSKCAGGRLGRFTLLLSGLLLTTTSVRADEPLEATVQLVSKEITLRKALTELITSAGLRLEIDDAAVADTGLKLDELVEVRIEKLPLEDALNELIVWQAYPGLMREVRGDRFVMTSLKARQATIRQGLPESLKPHYGQGLLARLGETGQVVSITAGEKLTDELLIEISKLPALRELTMVADQVTSRGLDALRDMDGLRSLTVSLHKTGSRKVGDAVIARLVDLQNLSELSINECGTTDAGVRLLTAMPALTTLRLYQEGLLTDAALESIGKIDRLNELSLVSHVATVALGRMHFTSAGVRQLKGLQRLERLHLDGHDTPADALPFPKLRALSLGGGQVDDSVAERVAELRNLRSLTLGFSAVSDAGLKSIASLPELTSLRLDSSVVTDAGIAELAAAAKLNDLQLRCSKLTDKSLQALTEMESLAALDLSGSGFPGAQTGERFSGSGLAQLQALPRLRTLRLSNLNGDDLASGLVPLKNLRHLSLMMVSLRFEELDRLADALPEATIQYMTSAWAEVRFPARVRHLQPKSFR